MMPNGWNTGEAEVVRCSELSAVLWDWRKRYCLEHDIPNEGRDGVFSMKSHPNGGRTDAISPLLPSQFLNQHTVSERWPKGIHRRRISAIFNNEYPHISLSQAEALLKAIDRLDEFHHSVRVIPNPLWTHERWLEYMAERGCA